MLNQKEVEKFLKESVDWLIKEDQGCCHFELDDRLALVVGWSDGYDAEPDELIASKSAPTYRINVGIRLNDSYMKTDMDTDFPMPYFKDSECYDNTCAPWKTEDYDRLANYFVTEYEAMKKLEINEDGMILGHKAFFELKDEIENDSDSWDFEEFKIMTTRISDASLNLYVEELNQLTELLDTKFAELQNK